jgi:hypothetical protein
MAPGGVDSREARDDNGLRIFGGREALPYMEASYHGIFRKACETRWANSARGGSNVMGPTVIEATSRRRFRFSRPGCRRIIQLPRQVADCGGFKMFTQQNTFDSSGPSSLWACSWGGVMEIGCYPLLWPRNQKGSAAMMARTEMLGQEGLSDLKAGFGLIEGLVFR